MSNKEIIIYTDGAARGNPGPGGYGVVMLFGNLRKEISEGFRNTTNNRMELLAVIEALRKLKKAPLKVLVFTDSKYVVDAVEKKWLQRWVKTNFKDKKNVDLWKAFLKEYPKHEVRFQWIKGHNNHPQNERCDVLAVAASKGKDLYIDSGFVKTT